MHDTTRRNCRCPQARHRHGTYLAYNADSCRCAECREAVRLQQIVVRRRRWQRFWAGQSLLLDPTGTRRRLQALAVLGWTSTEIGARLAVTPQAICAIRSTPHPVLVQTAQRVAELYDELAMCRPDPWKWTNSRAVRASKLKGWLPPLDYDDDGIDAQITNDLHPGVDAPKSAAFIDEVAVEQAIGGRHVHLSIAERTVAVARLTAWGLSAAQIAERLHLSRRGVVRGRARGRAA